MVALALSLPANFSFFFLSCGKATGSNLLGPASAYSITSFGLRKGGVLLMCSARERSCSFLKRKNLKFYFVVLVILLQKLINTINFLGGRQKYYLYLHRFQVNTLPKSKNEKHSFR